jgi:hypothetical protein
MHVHNIFLLNKGKVGSLFHGDERISDRRGRVLITSEKENCTNGRKAEME